MYLHTKKQLMYFDEVIRLHFNEGLGENRIAMRVPVSSSTIGRWLSTYKESHHPSSPVLMSESPDSELESPDRKIKEMHESGMSIRAIGRVVGLSGATVWRKITKFAHENKEQDMPHTKKDVKPMPEQDAQARIAELEAKLRMAELARDAYDEMINVAEAKFNIPIRKKAGAKR